VGDQTPAMFRFGGTNPAQIEAAIAAIVERAG
jgi:hypothetical protein